MTLQQHVRKWLGFNDLQDRLFNLQSQVHALREDLTEPLSSLAATLLTEDSQARQNLSSKLGAKVTKQLVAEAKARYLTEEGNA